MNREFVLPALRYELGREAKNLTGDRLEKIHPRFDRATDICFDGKGTMAQDRRIEQPKFRLPAKLSQFGYRLSADAAFALPGDENHPAGYLLTNVREPRPTEPLPSAVLEEKPVIMTPADHAWLEEDQLFVVSEVPFSLLQGGNEWRQFASTPELIAGLWNPSLEYGPDVSVTVHARLLQPVLDLLLVFLGLPLVLARESRNVFISAGSCLIMVALFMGVLLACHGMGMSYLLSPALATWCPLLIFVPVALAISEPLRR
jgi:lipopolysaccharide export system permease protein